MNIETKPKKSNKKIIIIIVFVVFIIITVTWRVIQISKNQIEDTNGDSTALETLNIEEYYQDNQDSAVFSGSLKKSENSIKYSFGKFSGLKLLQETKAASSFKLDIISEIEEGNFEVAVYKDNVCIKVLNANENKSLSFEEAGAYTVVIGWEYN